MSELLPLYRSLNRRASAVRAALWCALPVAVAVWLSPGAQSAVLSGLLFATLFGAGLAAWRVRGLAAEQLLAVRVAASGRGSLPRGEVEHDPELARLGDGLATWLEHEPRAASRPLLGWLTHELDRAVAALPAGRARSAGSRRLGRLRWALVLLVLLLLAWLLLQFWQPPWPGLLGGRPDRAADGAGGVAIGAGGGVGVPGDFGGSGGAAGESGEGSDGTGTDGTGSTQPDPNEPGAEPGPGQPDPKVAGEQPQPNAPATGESNPPGPTTPGGGDPQSNEPEPNSTGPGQSEGPQPEPPQPEQPQPEQPQPEQPQPEQPQQEDPKPPQPEDPQPEDPNDPDAAGPSAEPAPLLDLPKDHRFVVPEFIGEGPTQRVRVHAAEVGGSGGDGGGSQAGGQRRAAAERPEKPPEPDAETFRRAEEAARAARHVPAAERPIVRRFFELLREAAK